ncbi:MAG: ArsS family sensor histidine kinase [Sulfurovum sp.]|nr:MAG: Sensor histidine kinase CpxA [Arcobacter lacus]
MNRQSIFFTISASFFITLLLVIISFFVLMSHNYSKKQSEMFEKYLPVAKMVMRKYNQSKEFDQEFNNSLKDIEYSLIESIKEINAITYNPKTKLLLDKKDPRKQGIFRILYLNDHNYIYLKNKNKTFLIRDDHTLNTSTHIYIILVFVIVISTIILLYIITLKKLTPLRLLKNKVKNLGDEEFDFEYCNLEGRDEVTLLALEFKSSATKLKNLKESRNVFIRNIMHELKTPITKGRFLTSLDQNEINNEKLKSVFNRLEGLINEFATIEELISSSKNIDKNNYFLDDIVDNAIDILMLEEDQITKNYENKKLNVNYKLFSIAIKNLIDNAIKYSKNRQVIILNDNENIVFRNEGKKLDYELHNYFEPFFKNEEKPKDSFGLGLYITYNILKANKYVLEYEYENGVNIFTAKKQHDL